MLSILAACRDNVKTKQYYAVNKFIETHSIEESLDTSRTLSFIKMHNFIAQNFKYQDDEDYFKDIDFRDERIGEFLESNIIREISRYNIYYALLGKLKQDFYLAFICDKRQAEFNDFFVSPMINNDFLFAIEQSNGMLGFVLPKNNDFGLFYDELPFYYENSKTQLVSPADMYRRKENYLDISRFVNTPKSTTKDNYRKISSMVNVKLESLNSTFQTKVTLAGQFSTMTRSIYTHDMLDKSINPIYGHKIYNISNSVNIIKKEVVKINNSFPYSAQFLFNYSDNTIIKKENDSIYTINLKNLISHIYEEIKPTRTQPFYSDFLFTDTYMYNFQFEKPIKEIVSVDTIKIASKFANLSIGVTQPQNNIIQFSSFFSFTNEEVSGNDLNKLFLIYEAIKKERFLKIKI